MVASSLPQAGAITPETKRFAIFAAAASLSTWAIDSAATQVGLPSMQTSLGITVTQSQWILNLTLMILAGLVTVGGALGDRAGRMRMFRLGLFLIIGGALVTAAGGLLGQFGVVLVGRAIQGVGAALALPASTALLLDVFPREERGFAQGRMIVISMAVTAFQCRGRQSGLTSDCLLRNRCRSAGSPTSPGPPFQHSDCADASRFSRV